MHLRFEFREKNKISKFWYKNSWLRQELIINRDDFEKIFLINVTWDFLWPISLKLDIHKDKWKLDNENHFWSVYINDLRIISEIIEFPSQFILFLERRFNLINLPKLQFADELDVFMDFLERGLYFEDWKAYGENFEKYTMLSMDTTLTDKIDRYYWQEWKKPVMSIKEDYKTIINNIELSNKKWFSEVSTFLLSINQDDTIKMLDELKGKVICDWKHHTFTWLFNDIWILGLMVIKNKNDTLNRQHYINYTKAKIWQTGLKKWYNLYFDVDNKWGFSFNDFDIITLLDSEKTDEYNMRVEELRNSKLWKFIDVKTWKKVYRKSPCPCWSWKKFKRCCHDKYYN